MLLIIYYKSDCIPSTKTTTTKNLCKAIDIVSSIGKKSDCDEKESSVILYVIWVSEASPTLGCSIERFRMIYICMCVGLYVYRMPKYIGGITWPKHAHAQSKFWAVKTDL